MLKFTRKARVAVIATGALLLLTGAAVAYFTTSGGGAATATVGTSTPLTLQATVAASLYPGSTASVTFTVSNTSTGHQQLGTVHLASIRACPSGDTWSGGSCTNGGTEVSGCESVETGAGDTNTANFWMPDVVENQDVAPGSNQPVTTGGTLKMNDLSSSQNSCENANLTLSFTS